jgi:hypothetical protein
MSAKIGDMPIAVIAVPECPARTLRAGRFA